MIRELEAEKNEGKLRKGKVEITLYGEKGEYSGEINAHGEAEGWGTLRCYNGDVYKGTFKSNRPEGVC